ncbi:FG-GAP-like repeat-containing protein [Lentzea pudingi]|uniref:FG-GAP-like repeat-containing protein n=1 Tax=Lentzea pudingi TaxID=1789439 RepID=UPI00166CF598|nr:FG-GAP-like repeat-containing protein [Lentzea pudingi]
MSILASLRRRFVLLAILVLLAGLVAPVASAVSATLCTGYAGCASTGRGDGGYGANSGTRYWGMEPGHNCTNYAAYRLQRNGANASYLQGHGMAYQWGSRAAQYGVPVNSTPAVGAIAWWAANSGGSGSTGHVAYVEEVGPGYIVVSEDNWGGNFHWKKMTPGGYYPTGFIHFKDMGQRDVTGDGRADLVAVSTGPTGSGRTEAHVLDAATGYSTWYSHWATAAGYSDGPNDRHLLGDVNGDGKPDLVIVGTGPTGSGRTEAHVLDGATNYSTWLAHWTTAAGYSNGPNDRHLLGDVNGDGRADLVIVGTGPTGSGRTEAHVLDAATGYSTWYAHWATASGYTDGPNGRHLLGDVNGDGRADLVIVGVGSTGSGRLEAHVLDAATGYSTWYAHWATTAGYAAPSDRFVLGDVNGDSRADLVVVSTGPTGSGRLEAHVLDSATGYSTWWAHWATLAGYAGPSDRFVM